MKNLADIGVVGLAAMGSNLARNLAHQGYRVAVFNRSASRTDDLIEKYGSEGSFVPATSIAEFVASLKKPRIAIVMVKAGDATQSMIDQLADAMEPGDIIIDGGNTYFEDTMRREKKLRARGLHFVGCGISGGEEGALHGPSMMPGGSDESWATLGPMLEKISAKAPDGSPCVTHIGEDGSGHFVKMVHNGIEYADMQLIAESYDLLRRGLGLSVERIAGVFDEWNKTELNSYLIEITAEVLHHTDAKTGKPFIDVVTDEAGMKGTGTWAVQTALSLSVPVPSIAEAVFARGLSGRTEQRAAAQKQGLPGPKARLDIDADDELAVAATIEDIRQALYASKIVAYAQGFDEIAAGAKRYGWDIDLGAVARIWRNGCIIRAQFLNRISDAYAAGTADVSLLFDPYFKSALASSQNSWRRVVARAAIGAVPTPAFSSSLAYYDGLRSDRLPAALIQCQRDLFGAHTYGRVDEPGVFHTLWTQENKSEEKF
ncbi:MAG: NADP-dependent phosphogluconate dehydrogenase [Aeriscardovia sp.]|nr:NADP-dependent phosphogluconate dehydrogenase [Aeriscardovia sp.]